jgi:PAS domain S-box-containing protein
LGILGGGIALMHENRDSEYDFEKEIAKFIGLAHDEAFKGSLMDNALLLRFMEFSPNAIFVYRDDIILYANKKAHEFWKSSCDEVLIGENIRKKLRVHEDYQEKVNERINTLEREEVSLPYMEQKFILEAGEILNVEVAASSFLVRGKMYFILFVRDITRRKKLEEELKKSHETYYRLINFFPDAVFLTKNGVIHFANQQGLSLVGARTLNEVLGANVLDFAHPDYRESVAQRINTMMKDREIIPPTELKIINLKGKLIDIEVKTMLLSLDNEEVAVAVLRDITERKVAEQNLRLLNEARQYDRIKTEFFANMSHEIRTPLNVIISSQQLISSYVSKCELDDTKKQKISKHLSIMKQNCNRLLRLFNNIIDITKIDSGFVDINLRNYNIINVIEDTVLSVSEYIEGKGISLTFDTEVEEVIMALDAEKLERVILNLLSNATKFTNPGGSIGVNIQQEDCNILISIKDTGIGIPLDKHHLIFERFIQVDKSFSRTHEGSGIGLSIVKSLVELHDGFIEVKSSPGEGSEFIITLPTKKMCANDSQLEIAFTSFERAQIEFSDIYNS